MSTVANLLVLDPLRTPSCQERLTDLEKCASQIAYVTGSLAFALFGGLIVAAFGNFSPNPIKKIMYCDAAFLGVSVVSAVAAKVFKKCAELNASRASTEAPVPEIRVTTETDPLLPPNDNKKNSEK